ncbi:MAG: hypothetical protein FWG85_05060 [Bacteroidetes bacterium]|nr:hypothetical protein [Bacteroidota bacterium]
METLELEKPINKIKKTYLDLNQYSRIPALDRAIEDIKYGRTKIYSSFEEFVDDMDSEEDDEI